MSIGSSVRLLEILKRKKKKKGVDYCLCEKQNFIGNLYSKQRRLDQKDRAAARAMLSWRKIVFFNPYQISNFSDFNKNNLSPTLYFT